jgi:hypothetical protein
MKLIESKTLGTAAASIEFTSIPQTFTDLVLVTSLRASTATNDAGLIINGSNENQSQKQLQGTGSAVSSSAYTFDIFLICSSGDTANTFSNSTHYFPNYTDSNNKSFSVDSVSENNATQAFQRIIAGLNSSTAAITSISMYPASGNFVVGSTVSLYGILKGSDGIVTTS